MKRIDLTGEGHFDKQTNTWYETPHTTTAKSNYDAPKQPQYNTSDKLIKMTKTTNEELRMVRNYFKNNK